jgi:hypothetical protein
MTEDPFLTRLREESRQLQYEPDEVALSRISARVRDRVAHPGVAELLARWFRPVAVSLATLAIAGAVAIVVVERGDESAMYDDTIEISLAGESYRVD